MKKKLFLHVGLHKTGTTAIQGYLFENKDKLIEQGILYPTTKFHPVGQQRLAYAFNGINSPHLSESDVNTGEIFIELKKKLEEIKHNTLIISSENMTPSSDVKVISKIYKVFIRYDVKVIIYLRNVSNYRQSLYREHIKLPNSETCSFSEFIPPYPLSFEAIVNPWESVFGEENVFIRSYDELKEKNISVIDDFNAVVGINGNDLEMPIKKKNPTYPNIALDLIRAANNYELSFNQRAKINSLILKFCYEYRLSAVWPYNEIEDPLVMQKNTEFINERHLKYLGNEKSSNYNYTNVNDLNANDTLEKLKNYMEQKGLNKDIDMNEISRVIRCNFKIQ